MSDMDPVQAAVAGVMGAFEAAISSVEDRPQRDGRGLDWKGIGLKSRLLTQGIQASQLSSDSPELHDRADALMRRIWSMVKSREDVKDKSLIANTIPTNERVILLQWARRAGWGPDEISQIMGWVMGENS